MEPTYKSTSEFTELHSSDCGFDDGRYENVGPRFIDGCPTSAGSSPSLRWRRGTNQSSGGGDAPVSIPHPITELPFHALSLSSLLFSFHPFLASHCNVRCRRGRRRYKRIVVRSSERGGEGTSVAIQSTVRHAPIWDSLSPPLLITFGMAVIVFGVLTEPSKPTELAKIVLRYALRPQIRNNGLVEVRFLWQLLGAVENLRNVLVKDGSGPCVKSASG